MRMDTFIRRHTEVIGGVYDAHTSSMPAPLRHTRIICVRCSVLSKYKAKKYNVCISARAYVCVCKCPRVYVFVYVCSLCNACICVYLCLVTKVNTNPTLFSRIPHIFPISGHDDGPTPFSSLPFVLFSLHSHTQK